MAYTSCAADIAANIMEDCSNRLVGGYTGKGLLIPLSFNPAFTVDASNPRIISAITLASGQKWCVIDNASMEQPFTDSSMQSNAEQGLRRFTKNVHFLIPSRGAAVAKQIVEPLADSAEGYLVVLEKKDRSGDGSFEVVGFEQGLKANADGIVRNEYENGGCTIVTMSTNEVNYEYSFFDTDYATTLAAFEALLTKAY